MAVSTWPFVKAVRAAWKTAADGSPAVDSVVEGCSACEELRCDGTVGAGGSPDEYGEITLDALVMNGHPTGTFVHLSSVEKPLHVCLDDLEKCYGDKKGQSFSL